MTLLIHSFLFIFKTYFIFSDISNIPSLLASKNIPTLIFTVYFLTDKPERQILIQPSNQFAFYGNTVLRKWKIILNFNCITLNTSTMYNNECHEKTTIQKMETLGMIP